MKQTVILLLLSILLLSSCEQKSTTSHDALKTIVRLKTTPVKNQGNSETCWIYAMLATIETEHLMRGDSVNLSPAYIVRKLINDQATSCYLSAGEKPVNMRGMGPMLIHTLQKYGAEPYDSYQDPDIINYNILKRKVEKLAMISARQGIGIAQFQDKINQMLDNEIGYMPAQFVFMLGAQYTPKEFAHSVCAPDEYLFMTSFTHHPFYQNIELEMPDNFTHDTYYNVPLDKMMKTIENKICQGHPVFWEGDTSESSCRLQAGIATLEEKNITQKKRQQAFERLRTTDDHAMELIGIAINKKGEKYFIAKNSYGPKQGVQGYVYLSYDYIAMKTIAIGLSKR